MISQKLNETKLKWKGEEGKSKRTLYLQIILSLLKLEIEIKE